MGRTVSTSFYCSGVVARVVYDIWFVSAVGMGAQTEQDEVDSNSNVHWIMMSPKQICFEHNDFAVWSSCFVNILSVCAGILCQLQLRLSWSRRIRFVVTETKGTGCMVHWNICMPCSWAATTTQPVSNGMKRHHVVLCLGCGILGNFWHTCLLRMFPRSGPEVCQSITLYSSVHSYLAVFPAYTWRHYSSSMFIYNNVWLCCATILM